MARGDENTRKQARYAVDLPVEIRHKNEVHLARALNLSVGGMFARTVADLPFGDTVTLRFALPGSGEKTEVNAHVRWVEKRADGENGIGLQFVNFRARHVWALNKFFAGKKPVG